MKGGRERERRSAERKDKSISHIGTRARSADLSSIQSAFHLVDNRRLFDQINRITRVRIRVTRFRSISRGPPRSFPQNFDPSPTTIYLRISIPVSLSFIPLGPLLTD